MSDERKVRRMVGAALMAIGLLVIALSGTCVIAFLPQAGSRGGDDGFLPLVFLLPLLFGVTAFWVGIRMRRRAADDDGESGR